ncbi:DUF669 domain-containing protein [Bacillus cereus]|uniref:DUF669 domain-containing protein n=1 Tax=Bacillus sp. SH7-1 TaxID=2217818 RepID=UPI0011C706FE|nr:DUF669 domain-containing protein [Bacillus sp. SH7-1]MCU5306701.1 DUF669 domain-containing protein [Bacillus cereus]MCU5687111.1 DUF669 domain-containing protein [Bacillus cereus]TXR98718.1 hypothetical protein DN390_16365 [Bacillus sp. SH7-1]
MFKVDHSQATEFEVIKPGEYEVTVVNYELKQAESGNNRVIVDYEIRSDVDQPFQGQKILFDNFTVTDKAMWRFQAASKAAQFPDGMQFSSYKEWADTFLNKPLRLVVGEREYNGKKYPEVKGFKVSEVAAPSTGFTVSDEDIPF